MCDFPSPRLERVVWKIAALYSKKQNQYGPNFTDTETGAASKRRVPVLTLYFTGTFKFKVKVVPVVMDNDIVLFCPAEWLMSNCRATLCQEKDLLTPSPSLSWQL